MANVNPAQELVERIRWLIRLRWAAIGGVLVTSSLADRLLSVTLPLKPIYGITAFLIVYNFVSLLYLKRIKPAKEAEILSAGNRAANAQISLDLLCLAALVHFSGGIENPFLFYFVFHMIIAGILLSRRAALLQATFAIFLFSSMVFTEYRGLLPHYCLQGFVPFSLHDNFIYMAGVLFVFVSTLYIAVYMATAVSDRLRERERSLQKANVSLSEKDRVKSEYVFRVTHDIKEHLAAIQSCIQPVTDGITGALNEKQADMLNRAKTRAGKLIFFVRSLLEITKIRLTKKLEKEELPLAEPLKTACDDLRPRAQSKGLALTVDIAPSVGNIRGVRVYLEEAISNILANAIKYTPRGGEVAVRAFAVKDAFRLEISDTGIGIPKEELPRLFEEFFRAGNAKKVEKTGTGLGLSISKEIVEMHEGKIGADSVEGKGALFFMEFPKII